MKLGDKRIKEQPKAELITEQRLLWMHRANEACMKGTADEWVTSFPQQRSRQGHSACTPLNPRVNSWLGPGQCVLLESNCSRYNITNTQKQISHSWRVQGGGVSVGSTLQLCSIQEWEVTARANLLTQNNQESTPLYIYYHKGVNSKVFDTHPHTQSIWMLSVHLPFQREGQRSLCERSHRSEECQRAHQSVSHHCWETSIHQQPFLPARGHISPTLWALLNTAITILIKAWQSWVSRSTTHQRWTSTHAFSSKWDVIQTKNPFWCQKHNRKLLLIIT